MPTNFNGAPSANANTDPGTNPNDTATAIAALQRQLDELKAQREANEARIAENNKEKAKYRMPLRIFLGGLVGAAMLTFGIGTYQAGKNASAKNAPTPTETDAPDVNDDEVLPPEVEEVLQNSEYAGEMPNGVTYDYEEYADRAHKEAYNAYGYDQSEAFGDRDATVEGIMKKAMDEPEALASYAEGLFTDEEKERLGIKGLNMVEIDGLLDKDGGGELQDDMLERLNDILRDEDNTFLEFYYENSTEKTNYIYFIDDNGDGKMTPDEMHLGYDTKKRNGAPQVDIYRNILVGSSKDGNTYRKTKMLDLNMYCGYQRNFSGAPDGVPQIPADEEVKEDPVQGSGGGAVTDNRTTPTKTQTKKPDPTPVKPTPTPDKPTEHTKKSTAQEIAHAGDATKLGLDQNTTPKTTANQDAANFAAVAAQQAAEEAAAREAERIRQEQELAQQRAAAEAVARENYADEAEHQEGAAAANEALEEAMDEAEDTQRENHEEIEKQVEDEARREEAQAQADEGGEKEEREAEAKADDTAGERANAFNNGDF